MTVLAPVWLMAEVADTPVEATFTPGIPSGVPSPVVPATPVTLTGMGLFQAPSPHVPQPQPCKVVFDNLCYPYNRITCISSWKLYCECSRC